MKALLGLGRYLDLSIGLGVVGLPNLSDSNPSMSGMATTVGAGLRLKRPRDALSWFGASPWIGAEALSLHGRSGSGDRVGIAAAAGLAFPVGRERRTWFGPFTRYVQVLESNPVRRGHRASDGLFAGFTLEVLF